VALVIQNVLRTNSIFEISKIADIQADFISEEVRTTNHMKTIIFISY